MRGAIPWLKSLLPAYMRSSYQTRVLASAFFQWVLFIKLVSFLTRKLWIDCFLKTKTRRYDRSLVTTPCSQLSYLLKDQTDLLTYPIALKEEAIAALAPLFCSLLLLQVRLPNCKSPLLIQFLYTDGLFDYLLSITCSINCLWSWYPEAYDLLLIKEKMHCWHIQSFRYSFTHQRPTSRPTSPIIASL
jgi:hypothetical protein